MSFNSTNKVSMVEYLAGTKNDELLFLNEESSNKVPKTKLEKRMFKRKAEKSSNMVSVELKPLLNHNLNKIKDDLTQVKDACKLSDAPYFIHKVSIIHIAKTNFLQNLL